MTIEATQGYRILTARDTLGGSGGLGAINTHPLNQGAMVLVAGSLFWLDRESVIPPDGATVIAPVAGPGRWHLVTAAGGGGELSVPTIAVLTALPATSPDRVWVESVQCYWRREVDSTAADDGITVAPAIGGGNWERIVATTSRDWLYEDTLYVDPVAGDDENAGTIAAPVLTLEELTRRLSVGQLQQDTLVQVLEGSIVSGTLDVDGGGHIVTLRGTVSAELTTTVDSYLYKDDGWPAQTCLLLGVGIADFAPYVGQRLRITAGGLDYLAWVAAADGATANISTPGTAVIAPGSALVIESLDTTIEELIFTCRDQLSVLKLESMNVERVEITTRLNSGEASTVHGCAVLGAYVEPGGIIPVRNSYFKNNDEEASLQVVECLITQNIFRASDYITFLRNLFLDTEVEFRDDVHSSYDLFYSTYVNVYSGRVNFGEATSGTSQMFGSSYLYVLEGRVDLRMTGGVDEDVAVYVQGVGFTLVQHFPVTANFRGATHVLDVQQGDNPWMGGGVMFVAWDDVRYDNDEQHGTATLVAGSVTVFARFADVRGAMVSVRDVAGTPGFLSVPVATRTANDFVVQSTEVADTSTIDWYVPKRVGAVIVMPRNENNVPPNSYSNPPV